MVVLSDVSMGLEVRTVECKDEHLARRLCSLMCAHCREASYLVQPVGSLLPSDTYSGGRSADGATAAAAAAATGSSAAARAARPRRKKAATQDGSLSEPAVGQGRVQQRRRGPEAFAGAVFLGVPVVLALMAALHKRGGGGGSGQ